MQSGLVFWKRPVIMSFFWNHEVMENFHGVVTAIEMTVRTLPLDRSHAPPINLPLAGGAQ